MLAAATDSINALRFLLTWPCGFVKVNKVNNLGDIALHYVASAGSLAGTRLLLEHGADADASNERSFRPLHRAIEGGSDQVFRGLVVAGANIEVRRLYRGRLYLQDLWI